MKSYTSKELLEISEKNFQEYFYYSSERKFRELGINLENDNWSLPLVHDATENAPTGASKYACFYEMVHSEKGISLVDHEGNLVHIGKPDFKPEIIARVPGKEPKFAKKEPGSAPKGLGFSFYLLRVLTLGIYGRKQYSDYKASVEAHQREVSEYEEAKAEFELKELNPYKEKVRLFNEHYKSLELMGKNIEDVKQYRMDDISDFKKEDEEMNAYDRSISATESAVTLRENARRRLDFLMGPANEANREKDEKTKEHMIRKSFLPKESFDGTYEQKQYNIMNVEYPKQNVFSDHEIALLGFAATCDVDIWTKAISHPIPGEEPVKSDIEAREEAIDKGGAWYNYTEALFTRSQRDSKPFVPTLNHSKLALADALKDMNNGDYTALGKIIRSGISCCTRSNMVVDNPDDGSTFVDYSFYVKEMLELLDKNPELEKAARNAGLTDEELDEARVNANMGETFERGVDAKYKLMYTPDITAEEKKEAIADIIGMRLTQQLLAKNSKEYTEGPLKKIKSECEEKIDELTAQCDAVSADNAAIYDQIGVYSNKMTTASLGYMAEYFGLKPSFDEDMMGVFKGKNRPQEIHDYICKNVKLDELVSLSPNRLLHELIPFHSGKYISQMYPKKHETVKNNQKEALPTKTDAKVMN